MISAFCFAVRHFKCKPFKVYDEGRLQRTGFYKTLTTDHMLCFITFFLKRQSPVTDKGKRVPLHLCILFTVNRQKLLRKRRWNIFTKIFFTILKGDLNVIKRSKGQSIYFFYFQLILPVLVSWHCPFDVFGPIGEESIRQPGCHLHRIFYLHQILTEMIWW